MQTITISDILLSGREDALAAIEEIEATGRLTNTADEPLTITDDLGREVTTEYAIAALRDGIAA